MLAVADDPGMHSSQNEQDSRFYADFARIPCLEPRDQQEAYDMTREAFDLSERFHLPVVVRLVTRLSHSRAVVRTAAARAAEPGAQGGRPEGWYLLPAPGPAGLGEAARPAARAAPLVGGLPLEPPRLNGAAAPADGAVLAELGVITTGLGGNYFEENVAELASAPPRLHIGVYPLPVEKIRRLAGAGAPPAGHRGGLPVRGAPAARPAARRGWRCWARRAGRSPAAASSPRTWCGRRWACRSARGRSCPD